MGMGGGGGQRCVKIDQVVGRNIEDTRKLERE
jgi:hypothetical protein